MRESDLCRHYNGFFAGCYPNMVSEVSWGEIKNVDLETLLYGEGEIPTIRLGAAEQMMLDDARRLSDDLGAQATILSLGAGMASSLARIAVVEPRETVKIATNLIPGIRSLLELNLRRMPDYSQERRVWTMAVRMERNFVNKLGSQRNRHDPPLPDLGWHNLVARAYNEGWVEYRDGFNLDNGKQREALGERLKHGPVVVEETRGPLHHSWGNSDRYRNLFDMLPPGSLVYSTSVNNVQAITRLPGVTRVEETGTEYRRIVMAD